MGDFNLNLLNYESHTETNEFFNTMNSYFLLPYILQPTRITDRSTTLIDNIYANTFTHNAISGNIITHIADHLPQFLIIEDIKINYKLLNYYKFDYSNFNKNNFVNNFSSIDWSKLSDDSLNTNDKFDVFYDKVSSYVHYHVPRRKLSKREIKLKFKPWISQEILKKMKYRDKLYSQLLNKPQDLDLKYLYNKVRNKIVNDLRNNKTKYYNNFFLSNKTNMTKLWSGIKSIININKNPINSITTLKEHSVN